MATNIDDFDVVQCRVYCQDAEQASVNTFHFLMQRQFGVLTTTLEDVATEFDNDIQADMKAMLSSRANYIGVDAQNLTKLPLGAAAVSRGNFGPGAIGGDALPRQVAGLVHWKTSLAGPGGRGRTYLPFVAQASNQNEGKPTIAYIGLVTAFITDMLAITDFNVGGRTGSAQLVIYSKASLLRPRHAYLVTSGQASDKWATIRKRGSFGRPNTAP